MQDSRYIYKASFRLDDAYYLKITEDVYADYHSLRSNYLRDT